jgi:hypothetical protein
MEFYLPKAKNASKSEINGLAFGQANTIRVSSPNKGGGGHLLMRTNDELFPQGIGLVPLLKARKTG